MLAERGPNAHVPDDRARDARRKAFGSIVAAGAVLLEDPAAFFVVLLRRVSAGWRIGLRCRWRIVLRCGLRKCDGRKDNENWKKMFWIHDHFPFQAGNRNR